MMFPRRYGYDDNVSLLDMCLAWGFFKLIRELFDIPIVGGSLRMFLRWVACACAVVICNMVTTDVFQWVMPSDDAIMFSFVLAIAWTIYYYIDMWEHL